MKIPWSGRAHSFEKRNKFSNRYYKNADPLTQGKYLKLFEKIWKFY